jgi:hypothetical protein
VRLGCYLAGPKFSFYLANQVLDVFSRRLNLRNTEGRFLNLRKHVFKAVYALAFALRRAELGDRFSELVAAEGITNRLRR